MKLPVKLPVKLPAKVSRVASKLLLKAKKSSPELCMGIGILCGGAAIIFAGIETWKGKEKLSEDISALKETSKAGYDKAHEENPELPVVPDDERKALHKKNMLSFGKDICKIYWKPFVLGVSGAVFIVGGHHILRKELSAVTAAYATLKTHYDKICKKLREEFGDEKAEEIIYGVKTVDAVDEETGQVHKVAMVDNVRNISPYAFQFDQGEYDSETEKFYWRNSVWSSSKLINQNTVASIQCTMNNLLKARGYVYENEVRLAFGVPPTKRGWKVGWVLGSEHGNGFIDFGVLPGPYQLSVNKLFMDEKNPMNTPIIDLNVDGSIEYIFDDILEYDTMISNIAGDKRKRQRNMLTTGR